MLLSLYIFKNLTLCLFSTEYQNFNFIGTSIGRVGNRIKLGKFKLDEKEYNLVVNNNANHLHGGSKGWDKVKKQLISIC